VTQRSQPRRCPGVVAPSTALQLGLIWRLPVAAGAADTPPTPARRLTIRGSWVRIPLPVCQAEFVVGRGSASRTIAVPPSVRAERPRRPEACVVSRLGRSLQKQRFDGRPQIKPTAPDLPRGKHPAPRPAFDCRAWHVQEVGNLGGRHHVLCRQGLHRAFSECLHIANYDDRPQPGSTAALLADDGVILQL
jgi:hypothetical protein